MAAKTDMPFDFDVTKYMSELKVPGVDVDALVATQQKNLEAMTAANRLAFEGMQAILKRQAELIRQAVEEAAAAATGIAGASTPTDKMLKQTELTKEAFERAVSNAREVAEMMAKSNTEVADLLNKRFTEVLDELKGVVAQAAKAAPGTAKK
ncbi:MAG: phasin family protein [Caenispirillum bisanense]|nr:phasin family protein [Caenispirillum bisanense]MCA1975264.1 phasin family protein [Caenispirillum sp.]